MDCSFCFLTDNIMRTVFLFWGLISRELRIGHDIFRHTSHKLRTFPNVVIYFKALQLVVNLLNKSVGVNAPISHVIVSVLCLYCQMSLVLLWKKLTKLNKTIILLTWICGQVIWMGTLHVSGYLVKSSTKTIQSWKKMSYVGGLGGNWKSTRREYGLMIRYNKSCKHLAIKYENIFMIKRSTILSFLKTLSRRMIRTLLTLKKYSALATTE